MMNGHLLHTLSIVQFHFLTTEQCCGVRTRELGGLDHLTAHLYHLHCMAELSVQVT